MLEGQHFEPTGRLAQFIRVLSDFERDEIEAAVDGLIQLLDERDGDADQENATGLEDAFEDHGEWAGPGCPVADESRAHYHPGGLIRDHEDHEDDDPAEPDDHHGDVADDEPLSWPERGEGKQPDEMGGGLRTCQGDDDEPDALDERRRFISAARRRRGTRRYMTPVDPNRPTGLSGGNVIRWPR